MLIQWTTLVSNTNTRNYLVPTTVFTSTTALPLPIRKLCLLALKKNIHVTFSIVISYHEGTWDIKVSMCSEIAPLASRSLLELWVPNPALRQAHQTPAHHAGHSGFAMACVPLGTSSFRILSRHSAPPPLIHLSARKYTYPKRKAITQQRPKTQGPVRVKWTFRKDWLLFVNSDLHLHFPFYLLSVTVKINK